MSNKFQVVFVTDSVGHVHSFTGPVAFWPNTKLRVEKIQFSEPLDFPDGYVFEEFSGIDEPEEHPGD